MALASPTLDIVLYNLAKIDMLQEEARRTSSDTLDDIFYNCQIQEIRRLVGKQQGSHHLTLGHPR